MKLIFLSLGLWGLMQASPLQAQQPLNLKDCMTYALSHATQLEIQRTDYADALLERRDALLQAFTPDISAGTNASTSFGRAVDPETNSYISMTSFSNSYGVNASITLFDGLSALNRIRIAKTAVRMGQSEKQKLEDEICLAVLENYCKVLFQDEMDKAWQAQVETARQHLTLIRRQYELGQKGYADVVQTEADLAEREYQAVLCRNSRDEALLDLKALMLWPSADSLQLDSEVLHPIEPDLNTPTAESAAQLTGFARMYQPKVLLAKGEMEKARYNVRAARGRLFPTLSLQGGWNTNYYTYPGKADYQAPSFSRQFRNNGGEYIQLSLSFPLYDRLRGLSNLKQKRHDYQRASATYRQTLRDIENEVTRALQDCEGARAACVQAEKRWQVQQEAYRLNEQEFTQGLISPIEFQTVTDTYLNAQAERLNARLQYRLKLSVVNYYKGIPYLEQQN